VNSRSKNWKNYGFEFLSIFIAVSSAFALNNWNDNRRNSNTENKILTEISNGLKKDIDDIKSNVNGHKAGLSACKYFSKVFAGGSVNLDSLMFNYFILTRDFISIQNIAGYETLKSKGLELIENDSLRLNIISLYEYDYNTLRKLEEEYSEMQFHKSYFQKINNELAPNIILNQDGVISGIKSPIEIEESERKKLTLYLWKIQANRDFILQFYSSIEKKIIDVRAEIERELKR
jgi:hypothetical protein